MTGFHIAQTCMHHPKSSSIFTYIYSYTCKLFQIGFMHRIVPCPECMSSESGLVKEFKRRSTEWSAIHIGVEMIDESNYTWVL